MIFFSLTSQFRYHVYNEDFIWYEIRSVVPILPPHRNLLTPPPIIQIQISTPLTPPHLMRKALNSDWKRIKEFSDKTRKIKICKFKSQTIQSIQRDPCVRKSRRENLHVSRYHKRIDFYHIVHPSLSVSWKSITVTDNIMQNSILCKNVTREIAQSLLTVVLRNGNEEKSIKVFWMK